MIPGSVPSSSAVIGSSKISNTVFLKPVIYLLHIGSIHLNKDVYVYRSQQTNILFL